MGIVWYWSLSGGGGPVDGVYGLEGVNCSFPLRGDDIALFSSSVRSGHRRRDRSRKGWAVGCMLRLGLGVKRGIVGVGEVECGESLCIHFWRLVLSSDYL